MAAKRSTWKGAQDTRRCAARSLFLGRAISVIRVTLPVTTKLIDISKFAEPRDEYLSLEISYPERYIISSFLRFNSDVQSVRLG